MHPWYIALFVVGTAIAVAAFVSECTLCRRRRADDSPADDGGGGAEMPPGDSSPT